jgi:hypothetical protein
MPDRSGLPHGTVRLTCDDPALNLVVLMGEEPPKLTGGMGGWEVTARPRQVGMTTWAGVEPFQLALAIMLDGHATGTSVEGALADLITVARGDAEAEPGIVGVDGIAVPVDRWVIEGIEFGDALLAAWSGERTRQPLTLTLREYVPPSYLQLRKRALLGAKGKTKVITTRKGDTPAKVALRVGCKYQDVRELNITSGLAAKANQALKVGTKLRVPVAKRKDRKGATRQGTT